MLKKSLCIFLLALGTAHGAWGAVKTEVVTYQDGGVTCKGYLAYDDAVAGKRPAVLLVHEWWGLGEQVKKNAERLAALGYVGFAVDMYGDGKLTEKMADAAAWSGEMKKDPGKSKPRFLAALNALKQRPEADPAKIAATGYCFGGTTVLDMARMGVDLKGVVSFHGGLATSVPVDSATPKAAVLVCHGADDPFISAEELASFKAEMAGRKADIKFVSYPGAVHSFTNPDVDKHGISGAKYNKAADEGSWKEMTAFLAAVLK
jgi:dienelactone hydrolase